MLVNLYSIPVYKIKLAEHEQVQEDFSDILENDEYFSKVPTWYSPVDTTYGNPDASNLPLYHHLANLAGKPTNKFVMPVPSLNIINGGAHAGN